MYMSLHSERTTVTYPMLAKHAKCSHGFAEKIIKEVEEYGERLTNYQRRRTVKPESG